MKLILAIDLKDGLVVQGKSGNRNEYVPLDWGISSSAEPLSYLSVMRPKYLYVADLDRVCLCGDQTEIILKLSPKVSEIYVDRGAKGPEDYLKHPIRSIVGTETITAPLSTFHGEFLSLDIKNGKVLPDNFDPVIFLENAENYDFEGYLIMNISDVGTEKGVNIELLKKFRRATKKVLFYGGGISSLDDLKILKECGFDGVIVATAVHKGKIPLEYIQRGELC